MQDVPFCGGVLPGPMPQVMETEFYLPNAFPTQGSAIEAGIKLDGRRSTRGLGAAAAMPEHSTRQHSVGWEFYPQIYSQPLDSCDSFQRLGSPR